MGLIKNIFGAVFGLIGGIFGAILGVFGVGKKSEYFLELDDAATGVKEALEAAPKAAEKALAAVGAGSSEKPAAAKPAAAAKTAASKKSAPAEKPQPTPSPVPISAPAVTNFSTDYLVNAGSNGSRRRPGPSLSPFRDLARQVKVPAK